MTDYFTAWPKGLAERMAPVVLALMLALLPGYATAQSTGWPEESTPEFDAMLERARAEAPLVLSAIAVLGEDFVGQFEADTGLEVQFLPGGGAEDRNRFRREVESGNLSIDVYIRGGSTVALAKAGLLRPVGDDIVLPEVLEPSNWRTGQVPFMDLAQTYMPVPSFYASGFVLYNSDLIDAAALSSWDALLGEEFNDKIVMRDPRAPGAGQAAASYIYVAKGQAYLEALANEQGVLLSADDRQLVDMVARGSRPVAIGSWSRVVERYREQGLDNLKVAWMPDGPGFMVGGAAALAVGKTAPNPNAAAVFVNWYLSKNGQAAFSKAMKVPSERTDITEVTWPDYIGLRDGVEYQNQYQETWYLESRGEISAIVKDIFKE